MYMLNTRIQQEYTYMYMHIHYMHMYIVTASAEYSSEYPAHNILQTKQTLNISQDTNVHVHVYTYCSTFCVCNVHAYSAFSLLTGRFSKLSCIECEFHVA